MTKAKDDKVLHTLQTYNVLRWQNIVARLKKKPSLAAARSSSKKYECVRCLKHFVHRSRLARHKAKFHDDGVGTAPPGQVKFFAAVIKCICCGAVFLNADQYANHSVLFHSELLASAYLMGGNDRLDDMLCSLRSTVIVASAYRCEFCDKRFSDLPTLFHHESLHDPAQGFGCKFSQRNFKTLEDVAAYRTSKREYDEEIPNVANVYWCNVCKNPFKTLHALYNHRYEMNHFFPRHTEKQPKAPGLIEHCAICGYLSNSATELVAHHNENHVKTTKAMHETAHSARRTSVVNQEESSKQLRPYLCEQCGKTYTQSSHLWQHLRFHNGVRPFTCPHTPCQRTFTIRPDLNDHVRKCHTGERPYECEVCGKRFLTGSVYYQHRLIHRGERRYACSDCDKCFYRADALKNHQRIHTGEKPFGCDVCGRKFRQRGDREKHVRVKHMKIR